MAVITKEDHPNCGAAMENDGECFSVVFKNDGTYNSQCLNSPIIDRRENNETVVGIISAVNKSFITGKLWGRRIYKELSEDGLLSSIEICPQYIGGDVMTEYERGYQRALEDINRPMAVVAEKWDPSECPRCGESFSNYEPCDDGYYTRATNMDRCPFCGQRLCLEGKWHSYAILCRGRKNAEAY